MSSSASPQHIKECDVSPTEKPDKKALEAVEKLREALQADQIEIPEK